LRGWKGVILDFAHKVIDPAFNDFVKEVVPTYPIGEILPKRGDAMIKAGDMFKNIQSGIIFTVKSVDPRTVILGTKDGFHSMFVNPDKIESQFMPIMEDEVKDKVKS
jgi:hypothetical protein